MGFETDAATFYQIRSRHRNDEVREVIGDDYAGVLVTDRGPSYDARALEGVHQQKCVAHALRSIREVLKEKKGRSRDFGSRLVMLLQEAVRLWHERRGGATRPDAYRSEAERIRRSVTHHLRERTLRDPDNQRLLNELGRHHDRGNLLRFLDEEGVEPTNNRAERALRPAVISRKVSQCSKTWDGAQAYAVFVSLIRTALKRDARSAVDALVRILETGLPPPLPSQA